jgi:glycosyltransferase involved in cell wall biosynthesis
MNPRVSVVIPSYNEPDQFLGDCLSSLQRQTMTAWEAVVVDDGSTRGNVEMVVARVADPRIRAIRQENRGLGGARNTGFEAARADLVLTLDADDRLDPSFLEVAVSALDADPKADCVFMDSQCFGRSREIRYFPDPLPPPCPQHPAYPDCGVLLRKWRWKDAGGFSQDRSLAGAEWWDFWLSAMERGMQARHIAKPLYLYRTHLEGASVTSSMYHDHRNREELYRRHQIFFESFSGPCPRAPHGIPAFLAQGYVTSSRASLLRGERGRALRLALRGFLIYPWHWSTAKQIAKALVSGSPPLNAVRRLIRGGRSDPKHGANQDKVPRT